MIKQELLQAFNREESDRVHDLLASHVAFMMGRKFEEADWGDVYCTGRNIENTGWSNLKIDIRHNNQGIEHKMLCYRKENILSACGCTLMHPSATRSIRFPSLDISADDAMHEVLNQYAAFLRQREQYVLENAKGYTYADMRTGWFLWQPSLREFLYFEERTQIPDPDGFRAEWVNVKQKGTRKPSKNLWIFEKDTGKKRFSVTTSAGAKIQPYFDVPAVGNKFLYHFVVIGEHINYNLVRIWVTDSTYRNLSNLLGCDPSNDYLSSIILKTTKDLDAKDRSDYSSCEEIAHSLLLSEEAYSAIQKYFPGSNDDCSMQSFIRHLQKN